MMCKLARQRTNNQEVLNVAERIDVSQEDETRFMQDWLSQRDEALRIADNQSTKHAKHAKHAMMGMATAEQME